MITVGKIGAYQDVRTRWYDPAWHLPDPEDRMVIVILSTGTIVSAEFDNDLSLWYEYGTNDELENGVVMWAYPPVLVGKS